MVASTKFEMLGSTFIFDARTDGRIRWIRKRHNSKMSTGVLDIDQVAELRDLLRKSSNIPLDEDLIKQAAEGNTDALEEISNDPEKIQTLAKALLGSAAFLDDTLKKAKE